MRKSQSFALQETDPAAGPASASENSGARSASARLEKLHSIQHMDAVIRRETSRADRSGREFSLVLFRIKRSKRHSVSTHRLIKTITARSRTTDEIGWFGDRHVCVVLPETPLAGAWVFADSVCDLAARRIPRPVAIVYSYPGNWFATGTHAKAAADDKNNTGTGGGGSGRITDSAFNRATGGRLAEFRAPSSSHGHGNGNGHAMTADDAQAAATDTDNELTPYFVTGLRAGLARQEMPAGSVETLLARPSPLWKRILDVTGASIGVAMASPLMLFAYVGIKLTSPGPAIFTQKRAGLGGRPFTIYKFRTMNVNAEAQKAALRKVSEQDGPAFKLTHDPRVFKFGSLLRKTSIDELPQLFNIIKGDMSIVGPRPLPVDEANNCAGWQRRRLDVTPGLTCIWQIFGRSKVTFSEWVRMDVAYIRRRTILHDLKLIFMTVPAVLMRRGAK
jgi:lipopolysaccharide/colanic/teichoic acid biosynthesis glycosyltransferase